MRAPLACLAIAAGLAGCGGDDPPDPAERPEQAGPEVADPGPIHVHGLGVDPADRTLYIATHTGLFRSPAGRRSAARVGDSYQDTMGFSVVGPGRFIGSGHPDGRAGMPPFLGLIESRDAGRSWRPVSLLGEADFHVLEAAGRRIYGFGSDFDSGRERLLVSDDGGRTWDERRTPEPLVSLAIDPEDRDRVIASGPGALHESRDAGRSWTTLDAAPGLIAWSRGGELIRVGPEGSVAASRDGGGSFGERGSLGGDAVAFEAHGGDLYAALEHGTVKLSGDGGRTWSVRSAP